MEQLQNSDCEEVKGTMQELIDMIIKKYATNPAPYVRQVSKIVSVQIDCSFCCFILYCGQNQTRQKIRNFISQKQIQQNEIFEWIVFYGIFVRGVLCISFFSQKASCIWLLSLVKYSGNHNVVQV